MRSVFQLLRLTPRDHDGQHVRTWRIEPSVEGRLKPQEDPLGNLVHVFSSDATVEGIRMRVAGEVETGDTHGVVSGAIERMPDLFYLRDTNLTRTDAAIRAFARDMAGDPAPDPLAALHRLLAGLHREVAYDTGRTDASTTAAEAFALRRGVCQDLTHIFLAAARSMEIPARYVSGYFFRSDGTIEQEAGHAWAEAKVPGLGWVGFDPTNGICTTAAYVRVAVGLDYLGAAPVRGSRVGGGTESLDVRLRVESAQSQSQN